MTLLTCLRGPLLRRWPSTPLLAPVFFSFHPSPVRSKELRFEPRWGTPLMKQPGGVCIAAPEMAAVQARIRGGKILRTAFSTETSPVQRLRSLCFSHQVIKPDINKMGGVCGSLKGNEQAQVGAAGKAHVAWALAAFASLPESSHWRHRTWILAQAALQEIVRQAVLTDCVHGCSAGRARQGQGGQRRGGICLAPGLPRHLMLGWRAGTRPERAPWYLR